MHTVRRSVTNAPLPSPRLVGNFIADIDSYKPPPQRTPNYGSVMFGQYIAHDVGNRNVYQNSEWMLLLLRYLFADCFLTLIVSKRNTRITIC